MRFAIPLTLVSFMFAYVAAPDSIEERPQVEILSACFRQISSKDCGSLHICILNNQDKPWTIERILVNGMEARNADPDWDTVMGGIEQRDDPGQWDLYRPDTKPGDILWVRATEWRIPPNGGMSEIILKFASRPQGKEMEVECVGQDGKSLSKHVSLSPTPLSLGNVGFSDDLGTLYLYIKNHHNKRVVLARLLLDGRPTDTFPSVAGYALETGETAMLKAATGKKLKHGDRIYIILETVDGQSFGTSVRAFSHFPIEGNFGIGVQTDMDGLKWKMILDDYGDLQYWYDIVGSRVVERLSDPRYLQADEFSYMCVAQGAIPPHVLAFGELCDGYLLHPQPSEVAYLGRYDNKDFHYSQAEIRYIKDAIEPHHLIAVTEIAHAYDKFYAPLTDDEQRLRIYYQIARGANGISYRLGQYGNFSEHQWEDRKQLLAQIHRELLAMRPLLRIGCPVEGVAQTSEPLVEAATILGGDKGMIVILLNHDRSFAWPEDEMANSERKPFWIEEKKDPVEVRIRLPEWAKAKDVYEIWGAQTKPQLRKGNSNEVSFVVKGLRTTRQFVIPLCDEERERVARLKESWLPTNVKLGCSEPDIQFDEKQWQFFDPEIHERFKQDPNIPSYLTGRWAKTFGVDPMASNVSHNFTFRNLGRQPLEVSVENLPAKDVTVSIQKSVLPSGEESVVRVSLNVSQLSGKIEREVWLKTNDPDEPRIRLIVGALMKPELSVSPSALQINSLDRDLPRTVKVLDNRSGLVRVTNAVPSGNGVRCSMREEIGKVMRSLADVNTGEHAQRRYEVDIQLVDPPKADTNISVRLQTTAPHRPEIIVPIAYKYVPSIEARPSSVLFGFVRPYETVSRKLQLRSRTARPFKITACRYDVPVKQVHFDDNLLAGEHDLVVDLTPVDKKDVFKSCIEVMTSDRECPKIEIPVVGYTRTSFSP